VERGSKIAFVGQNGQGKSTFIKAIVNEFEYEGDIKLGHNVQVGYFAQNQAEYLDGEITTSNYGGCSEILIVQSARYAGFIPLSW
jgi:ATPase subunit of ABC transporter with duplicated ATPase domains